MIQPKYKHEENLQWQNYIKSSGVQENILIQKEIYS